MKNFLLNNVSNESNYIDKIRFSNSQIVPQKSEGGGARL